MIKHKYVKIVLIICFSVLIIALLIIGLFKLIESSRLENKDYKPRKLENSSFVSLSAISIARLISVLS